ncbi:MAG: glycosyltransferase [Prevotella sp.]|nr:glycosyltransferase [Prevotella sp.]
MKQAIGIVTYQPDLQRLQENVAAAAAQAGAGHVIIVDNGSDNLSDIRAIANTVLIENGENLGIAHALNQLCRKAQGLGYEWIVTLDQDSVMQSDTLSEFARYTDKKDIGIICPRIEDRHIGRQYARSDHGTEYIRHCITSGNLIRLQAWEAVGGFTDELFIDGVDFDFCLKLHEGGWQILRTNNVCLIQEMGHGHRIPLPFHHQISILNHSPQRLYYIARNYLYIGRRYHQRLHWTLEVAKRMLIVVCFESQKLPKCRAMLKGIRKSRDFLAISK